MEKSSIAREQRAKCANLHSLQTRDRDRAGDWWPHSVLFEYIRSEEFKKINDQVALASTPSTSAYIKLQIIASITSLIVVIINFSLDTLTTMLSRLSAYKTQTAHKNVLIASLTFVNLLNYVVVPIITNRCSSVADGVCNWYRSAVSSNTHSTSSCSE